MEFRNTATATISAGGSGDGSSGGNARRSRRPRERLRFDRLLTVTAATLVSIAVTPANPSIAKGTTQQFTATGTYTDSSTAEHDEQRDVEFGEHQRRRRSAQAGWRREWRQEPRRSRRPRERSRGSTTVDGDAGNAGVDRGDAGESIDREGHDAAVHGDGDVLG